jgi:hypothetical protein
MIRRKQTMVTEDSKYLLLKKPGNAYICEFEDISEETPNSGYPEYYKTEIFPNRQFSIWFKLISIKEINNIDLLNHVITKSSLNPILESTARSIAPHFFTFTKEEIDF